MRWGWVDELHDQLRERVIDGERGGIGSEREQHEPCVRGDEPGVHGKLQWFCERGRDERAERGAGIDDECGDEQSCGQLRDHQQHRDIGGDELCGESDERVADGQSGGIDVDGEQPGEGIRSDAEFCGTEFGASGLLNGDSVSSASLSSAGSAAVASVAGRRTAS